MIEAGSIGVWHKAPGRGAINDWAHVVAAAHSPECLSGDDRATGRADNDGWNGEFGGYR